MVDVTDSLLEHVDHTIDELRGVSGVTKVSTQVSREFLSGSKVSVIRGANILRPQLKFNPPVDNNPISPFIPKLHSKPNAITPLLDIFKPSSIGAVLGESEISAAMQSHLTSRLGIGFLSTKIPHPYQKELEVN